MRRLALALLLPLVGCDCEGAGVTELTPLITPGADRLDFGPVFLGAAPVRSVELRSSGTAPLDLGDFDLVGTGFSLEAAEPGLLSPGGTRVVEVRYTPLIAGPASGELVVTSDAANDPTLRVALSAVALEPLDCPANNPCLESTFDPDQGACVNTFVEGNCDDGSGCTEDDVCVDGQCLGTAVSCPADDVCSIGVCAAEQGCFSVPDPDACDDGNPCTEDLCDPLTGCAHPFVEDGTPCGASFGCQAAPLCFLGVCTEFAAPDGTPCNDGDLCTTGDQCVAGTCGGERVERQPEVVGRVELFGGRGARAVSLTADRVAFVDPNPVRVHLAAVDSAGLTPLVSAEAPLQPDALRLRRVSADRFLIVGFGGQGTTIVDVTGDVVNVRGSVDPTCHDAAASGDRLYCCDSQSPVTRIYDISDADGPALVNQAATGNCFRVVADGAALVTTSNEAVVSWTISGDVLVERARVDRVDTNVIPLPSLSGGRLYLNDELAAALHDLDLVELFRFDSLSAGALGGDRLARARGLGGVEVWDLSGATPTLVHSINAAVIGDIDLEPSGQIAVARQSDTLSVLDLSDPARPGRTHPEHGAATHAFSTGIQLYALSRSSVRTLDATDPTNVTGDRGGHTLLNAFGTAYNLGGAVGAPIVPVGFATNPYVTFGSYVVVDAADPEAPVLTHNLNLDATSWVGDGRFLYAVDADRDAAGAFFAVFAYDALDQPSTGTPQLLEERAVALGDAPPGFSLGSARTIAAVDGATDRLAITAFAGGSGLALALVDVSDLQGPPVGLAAPAPQLTDIAVAGDNVLGVENNSLAQFGGTRVVLFRPLDAALVEVSSLDVAGVEDILAFDGRTAILGTATGLRFLDFSQSPPVDLGALATEPEPISAALHDDHLVIASGDAVELISPPCPPVSP